VITNGLEVWPEEVQMAILETRKHEEERHAEMRVVAALLRGGSTVFGSRIEVVWPDGPPYGKSNVELADMIDRRHQSDQPT
jgi:hypothetical protein